MTRAVTAVSPSRGTRTPVIALIVAEGLSAIGTRISFVALPWLVLVTSHNPIRMGIVTGAASLPYVLNGFIASPLVDKIGARRMSNISDVASAILMGLVAVAYNQGIVVLAVLVAAAGSFRGVGDRAKNVMLKPLLDATSIDTLRVTSAYTGVSQLALLTGGSVAGVLIALFNPWGAIWIDAASFLVCAAIVVVFVVMPPEPEPVRKPPKNVDGVYHSAAVKPPSRSYLNQLKDSFTFLANQKLISRMVSMLFVTNLFSQVGMVTFIPLWIDANQHQSPIALGWIGGAFSLGGVAGNAVFTALATKIPRYRAFVGGYLIGGAPRFLILAFSHNLVVVAAVWAVSGFAMSSTNPTIGAVMYRAVPANMLARVGSLASAISFAGIAVGGLVGGFTVENLGFVHAVVLAGVIYVAASLSPIFGYRTWRLIDVITKPGRAAAARIAVRMVLAQHRWSATVTGRAGAVVVEDHYIDGSTANLALGLMKPPELHDALQDMLAYEHGALIARDEDLRARLRAAEAGLVRVGRSVPILAVDAAEAAVSPGPNGANGSNGSNGSNGHRLSLGDTAEYTDPLGKAL
jgi:MFS family permease